MIFKLKGYRTILMSLAVVGQCVVGLFHEITTMGPGESFDWKAILGWLVGGTAGAALLPLRAAIKELLQAIQKVKK